METSLKEQTDSHVILNKTCAHGTMTTLPAFCGKGMMGISMDMVCKEECCFSNCCYSKDKTQNYDLTDLFPSLPPAGYYMYITARKSLDPSSAARLISFPNSTAQVICVSFSYYIFGSSIGMCHAMFSPAFANQFQMCPYFICADVPVLSGSLKFIAKYSKGEEMVMWMRSGTQGDKWRMADLTFSDKPTQVFLLS